MANDVADKQRAGNRALAEELTKRGDALTKVRAINHFAYFATEAAGTAFAVRLRQDGFLLDNSMPSQIEDGRFEVYFSHNDIPDQDVMDRITIFLAELALELGGDYDGWETAVIT